MSPKPPRSGCRRWPRSPAVAPSSCRATSVPRTATSPPTTRPFGAAKLAERREAVSMKPPRSAAGKQLRREFPLPFRRRECAMTCFRPHAEFAELCRHSISNPQSVQRGTQPLQPTEFQTEPRRCSRRIAQSLCGLTISLSVPVETGSLPSDTSLQFRSLHGVTSPSFGSFDKK